MTTIIRNIKDDIMSTDLYLSLSSENISKKEIENELFQVEDTLREFERKYSRFIKGNELDILNSAEETLVSEELFNILQISKNYFVKTLGIFDPAIYPILVSEGYTRSKREGFTNSSAEDFYKNVSEKTYTFSDVDLDAKTLNVKKPLNLKIDLGGIGKGYIIDKITNKLKDRYQNFCLSLGGDMYLGGRDVENKYDWWAINIEDPFNDFETPTLLLSNMAVATSGVHKRKWIKNGSEKNHIIDPRTKESVKGNVVCVTVVATNVIEADVMAKYLLLLDVEKGIEYCENEGISAVFLTKDKKILISEACEKYVWKD